MEAESAPLIGWETVVTLEAYCVMHGLRPSQFIRKLILRELAIDIEAHEVLTQVDLIMPVIRTLDTLLHQIEQEEQVTPRLLNEIIGEVKKAILF